MSAVNDLVLFLMLFLVLCRQSSQSKLGHSTKNVHFYVGKYEEDKDLNPSNWARILLMLMVLCEGFLVCAYNLLTLTALTYLL